TLLASLHGPHSRKCRLRLTPFALRSDTTIQQHNHPHPDCYHPPNPPSRPPSLHTPTTPGASPNPHNLEDLPHRLSGHRHKTNPCSVTPSSRQHTYPAAHNLKFRWETTNLTYGLLTGASSDVKIKRTGFMHDQNRDKYSIGGMMHNPTAPPPSPQLDPSDAMFSKLMRSCLNLRDLSILHYIAGIESFERDDECVCQNLEALYMKAQGLNEVDACVTKIMALKNNNTWRSSGQVKVEGHGIGDGVTKRLIGLCRLKTVWLGIKDKTRDSPD
ncbi:hypothetical protein EC957_012420, partial [Mortierella hygrophila]